MRVNDPEELRKTSTRDYAYIRLKQLIVSGELKPDQPIVEDRIAQTLSISRTPIREALQRLEMEQLIARQPNGRLKVAPISIKEVQEIYMVRSKLEEIVVVEAINRATDADYDHLSNLILLIRETFKQNNIDDALYYGGQFHQYIYDLSNHQLARDILSQINDRIYRYRSLMPHEQSERFKESIEEHKYILSFMKEKNHAKALQTVQKHLDNSLAVIIQAIDNQFKNRGKSNE